MDRIFKSPPPLHNVFRQELNSQNQMVKQYKYKYSHIRCSAVRYIGWQGNSSQIISTYTKYIDLPYTTQSGYSNIRNSTTKH
jgi:hypothetical protein